MTTKARPSPLSTKSFTRYEPSTTLPAASVRSRASTVASPVFDRKSIEDERQDVFDKTQNEDEEEISPELNQTHSLPERFDELPVELISLTDRFVESLRSKAFTEPPTIDQIIQLFQEFYIRASSNISIHIASLRLKLNRDASPSATLLSGKRSLASKQSTGSLRPPGGSGSQQMLTATEVTERRKQRKLLDYKKLMLEEAVERRACEMIYEKIWRHKSTLDEVQDEKLRSKTAALALVGVGLKDLGVEPGKNPDQTLEDIQEALTPAREGLIKMNEEHYPLGKLECLTEAHKVIVETLSRMHGSSSSADEILPTLIYTLISAPVEGINIISNLNFIQRFRASNKLDGEAAYCLTNLEAAIGFLENVDLASLRADELPEGPRKVSSGQQTPSTEKTEPFPAFATTTSVAPATTTAETVTAQKPSAAKDGLQANKSMAAARSLPPPRHQRTLSDLLKPVQNANEAVRASAREGLDNISNTLDNSLKFFFGRLKEQAADLSYSDDLTVPKTLDEARQLVSKPNTPVLGDDGAIISETSSNAGDAISESPDGLEKERKIPSEDKLLGLFGGRRTVSTGTRDRSVDRDSLRSNSSTKKVAFASGSEPKLGVTTPSQPIGNPLDAVKNFGGSLNPLGHVGNAFNAFKGFGRPAVTPSPPQSSANVQKEIIKTEQSSAPIQSENNTEDEPQVAIFMDNPERHVAKIKSVLPPIKKFIEASSAADLQIRDVDRLLSDYKRLAALLHELASQDLEDIDAPK